VPNAHRRIVRLADVFQEPPADWSPLTVWLGKDVAGRRSAPTWRRWAPPASWRARTGAGKSGAVNAMLSRSCCARRPTRCGSCSVDPKQVELNHYESIPHLLTPVITSPRMAANALQNLVREMEQRYGHHEPVADPQLVELNRCAREARRSAAALHPVLIDRARRPDDGRAGDVEDSIIRLAQKARAVGIHLVLATQSPRVDVITGMIKANVPSRSPSRSPRRPIRA